MLKVLLILSLSSFTVLADESFRNFMNDISQAEQNIDYSERLTPVDGIHKLIPNRRELKHNKMADKAHDNRLKIGKVTPLSENILKKPTPKNKPKPTSYALSELEKMKAFNQSKYKKPRRKTKFDESQYISPSLRLNSQVMRKNTVSVTFPTKSNTVYFGIYIGTKIPVKIYETINNVQAGFIQLKTIQGMIGDKETLPAGTTIFARPSAVIGSDRIYLNVFKGLTPDGKEFKVGGSFISAEDESFGLVGRVENDGKALARAGDVAVNTLGRGLLGSVPAGAGVDALKDGGLTLLNENRQGGRQENGRPVYIVVAEPQSGFIQISATF